MGIKEDIFSEFFKTLELDGDFPKPILKSLKILQDSNELNNKEKLNRILNEV
jgi:hypothetical protein